MRNVQWLLVCLSLIFISKLMAADHGNAFDSRYRVVCVLPFTGSGTYSDPRRPAYMPVAAALAETAQSGHGILAYSFQSSDDDEFAITEIAASDRNALKNLLADPSLTGRIFERTRYSPAQIEAAVRSYKKTYSVNGTRAVAQ